MRDILIRCSSIGRLMASSTAAAIKAGEMLSVGAKTFIRELAQQDILGVEFEVSTKEMEKGIECEPESIALLNRVRGLELKKNTERKSNGYITGECDLFDVSRRRGHDLKTAWSVATFPCWKVDAYSSVYEWQMRGYMWLWDADEWEVDHALVDTPENLIRWEPVSMHIVSHIPEHMRLTSWTVKRDPELEAAMIEKVKAARLYYADVVKEFEVLHPESSITVTA